MSVHNQYFRDLSKHPKIMSMVSELLGPDVKLLQSMSLLKPPGENIFINCYAYIFAMLLS